MRQIELLVERGPADMTRRGPPWSIVEQPPQSSHRSRASLTSTYCISAAAACGFGGDAIAAPSRRARRRKGRDRRPPDNSMGSTLAVEVVARALEIEYQARSDLISFYKFDSRGLSHTMSDHKDFVHLPALRRPCGATVDPQRVPAEWCELRNRNTSPHPQEHDL
jgi:hypothetical protein